MPPDLLEDYLHHQILDEYKNSSYIWSLGVLLYRLIYSGAYPFEVSENP